MKWQIRITGNSDSLRKATSYFSEDEDGFKIVKIDTHFYIEKELDTYKQEAAFREAEDIAVLINGALRIINNEEANVHLTDVKIANKLNEDGSRGMGTVIIDNTGSLSTDVKLTITDGEGNIESEYPKDEIKQLYAGGRKNDNVNNVLRLSNNLDSWDDLWRIHEVIEADTQGYKNMDQWSDITKTQMELFSRTVNHQKAIGLKARHMTNNAEPPQNPMSLSQAQNTIKRLISHWIKEKL